jgi:hypothetical protein
MLSPSFPDACQDLEHVSSDGEWITISLVANLFELQIEYDPRLIFDEQERSSLPLLSDYVVQRSVVQVLPFDATDLTISPAQPASKRVETGVYLTKDVGCRKPTEIEIGYSRESDVLGISRLPVESSEPLTSEPDWQGRMLGALPWILGLGGVLLIAGGVIWYWKSGQQNQPAGRKRHRSRQAPAMTEAAPVREGVYVTNAGELRVIGSAGIVAPV